MCSSASVVVEQVTADVAGLDEEILALVELKERVDAAITERVGVFDATEGWAADGAYSFACWLRARTDITRTESGQLSRFARTLRTMPATEAAVSDGKLSVTKARLLAGVINERTRERFDDQEAFLLDQIQSLDVDNTKLALAYWKRLADTDGPDPGDPNRNRASVTTGLDGRWHLDADLDPAAGAVVQSVLRAIVDRMHQSGCFAGLGDHDTASRRTADALVEMAHRSSGPDPDRSAVHPEIVIVVPHDRLTENEPDPFAPAPTLVGGGPLNLNDVFRLAFLGAVSKMTIDDQGRPLNLGRTQRLATADQWIALRVRDRGCVAPGCHRPADYCQAHHLQWWDRHGGLTDLANLCLLCSAHHALIHKGWGLHQDPEATWILTRPDGTTPDPPRYSGNQNPRPRTRPPD